MKEAERPDKVCKKCGGPLGLGQATIGLCGWCINEADKRVRIPRLGYFGKAASL